MNVTKPRRGAELMVAAVAVAALLAALLLWPPLTPESGAEVVGDGSAQEGWQTIQYEGVRVDIPDDWERSDMDDCEFQSEHWAPPDSPECGRGGGISFYGSATFGLAHGPGVRRTEKMGSDAGAAWGGYVIVGEFAVYVSTDGRDLAEAILNSARVA